MADDDTMRIPPVRRGRWTGGPRTIEVWCEAPSHDPIYIGKLTSRKLALYEQWGVSGPHVTTQRLAARADRNAATGFLADLGLLAERHRMRCPRCGLDVVAGDRLGYPGTRTVWENRHRNPGDERSMRAYDEASETTDARLSQVANSGLTKLSLSAVGRIVSPM